MESANIFCGSCGKKLNLGTQFCVHCGAQVTVPSDVQVSSNISSRIQQVPTQRVKAPKRRWGIVKLFFAALLVLFIAFVIFAMMQPDSNHQTNSSTQAKPSDTPSDKQPSPAPTVQQSEDNQAQNNSIDLTNAEALDDKYGLTAIADCDTEADDYLRSIAKYDFNWDHIGFLETKFEKYLKKAPSPGVLVMVSDKAKLQNGFGAYLHIELFCAYDTQAQKVLSYSTDNTGNE